MKLLVRTVLVFSLGVGAAAAVAVPVMPAFGEPGDRAVVCRLVAGAGAADAGGAGDARAEARVGTAAGSDAVDGTAGLSPPGCATDVAAGRGRPDPADAVAAADPHGDVYGRPDLLAGVAFGAVALAHGCTDASGHRSCEAAPGGARFAGATGDTAPQPASLALLGAALFAAGAARRRAG